MKIKKSALLLAIVMLITAVAAGCTKKETASNSDEPYNLVWYNNVTPTRDIKMVFEEVSKITKEKINATVECIPIISAEYAQKMNMLIASGEKIDVMRASAYSTNASNGSYYPLSKLIEEKGKDIKKVLPEYVWDAVKINGEIYGVPALKDYPTHRVIWYYEKYADKYGFDMQKVTNLKELEPILQTIKDNEPGILPLATTGKTPLHIFLPHENIDACKALTFKRDGDYSEIVSKYETEEFKEYVKLMREWNLKGFFRPDAATQANSRDLIGAHKVFADYGSTIPLYEDTRNIGVEKSLHTKFAYNMDIPRINTQSIQGSVATIYSKSENPEKAMEFINLMFTDKELINTVVFGIKDKHYIPVGENQFKYPEGFQGNSNDDYYFPEYTLGNRFLLRIHESLPEDKWEQYEEFNASAEISPALGFCFDTAPVINEITAINNVISEFIPSLYVGAVDPDEYLPKAIEKLKKSGLDRVVEEANRQYKEWKKNK